MGRIIHVVGTDTGVGKTMVAAALVRGIKDRGLDVGVCKPFASGEDPVKVPTDAVILMEAAGLRDGAAIAAPVRFLTPASPWAASREEGREGGLEIASEAIRTLGALHAILVVEGIGGVAVPIDTGVLYVDFLMEHPGDVLLVARAGLGTLNHTILTVEALRTRGAHVAGIVLNRTGTSADPSERLNPAAIEDFASSKILADLTFIPESRGRPQLPEGLFESLGLG